MKKSTIKQRQSLFIFLLFNLILWFIQAFHKIYYQHAYQNIFWLSSLGYLIAIISIYRKHLFIFSSMFCSLFFFEFLWSISLISQFIFGNNIYNITSYMFLPTAKLLDNIIGLYHLFIIPMLIVGLLQIKKIHRFGWFGAFVFLLSMAYLSYYFLPQGWSNINCVYTDKVGICRVFFSIFYNYPRPIGILLANILIMFLIFIPTNIGLILLSKKINQFNHKT